jgi:hypothetical protein
MGEASADGRSIAFRALRAEFKPVVAVGPIIRQPGRRFTDIQNQSIDSTTIPNVAERHPTV